MNDISYYPLQHARFYSVRTSQSTAPNFPPKNPDSKPNRARAALQPLANSCKNSNASQFFAILTDDESKLTKMSGKYVVFGQVRQGDGDEGRKVLQRLDKVGGGADGKPSVPVWIGGCGVC